MWLTGELETKWWRLPIGLLSSDDKENFLISRNLILVKKDHPLFESVGMTIRQSARWLLSTSDLQQKKMPIDWMLCDPWAPVSQAEYKS